MKRFIRNSSRLPRSSEVFGILVVLARRLDRYHLGKLPLKERELLLLRLHLDGSLALSGEIVGGLVS